MITHEILLEVTTSKIFEITFGEWRAGKNDNTMTVKFCPNLLTEVVSLAVNFDVRFEVVFLK